VVPVLYLRPCLVQAIVLPLLLVLLVLLVPVQVLLVPVQVLLVPVQVLPLPTTVLLMPLMPAHLLPVLLVQLVEWLQHWHLVVPELVQRPPVDHLSLLQLSRH
jgi:hypothetical protein